MAKKRIAPVDPITITPADGITAAEASDAGTVLAQYADQPEPAPEPRMAAVDAAVLYTDASGRPSVATIMALFGENVDLNVNGRLVELVRYSESPALNTWRWPSNE